jgi:phosphinothricin acetyltransferase
MATADTEPTTVAAREPWFAEFDPARRPLWVLTGTVGGPVLGWLSLRSFYGRPAYHATVEAGVYTHPGHLRAGIGKTLLIHVATDRAGIRTCRLRFGTMRRRWVCSSAAIGIWKVAEVAAPTAWSAMS